MAPVARVDDAESTSTTTEKQWEIPDSGSY